MANHALSTVFLKVNISCCKSCPKKLQKALLEINGVYSVGMDPENELVSVKGRVDPKVLLKAIEEEGKFAELLSPEKVPTTKHNRHCCADQSDNETSDEECPQSQKEHIRHTAAGRNKNRACACPCPKKFSRTREDNDAHKFEEYVQPRIDPETCRDPYCKLHRRRPIITQREPSRDSGDHPHHTSGFFENPHHANGIFGRGNSPYYHGNSFQFGPSGRPGFGLDSSNYYGDEYGRGCSIM